MTRAFRRLPRIRTLLLATYLTVLLLPVAGIGMLRLYESALLRQTEAELLAQAAVLSAVYRSSWMERAPPGALTAMPKATLRWGAPSSPRSIDQGLVLQPQLDFADTTILPRAPDAAVTDRRPEPVATEVAGVLSSVVGEVRRMTLAGVRIVDSAGIVVASTGGELGLSLAAQTEVAHALQGAPIAVLRERVTQSPDQGWESISRNTDVRVFVAVPVVAEGHVLGAVLVSRTPRNIVQTLYGKRFALLGLTVVLVASVLALAWFAGRTIVRPTRQLEAMARRVASGEVHAVEPLANPRTYELRSLSESIVTMAHALEARADYVRDLALGISHEFKTPLTAIRGSAELLRDHLQEMSDEERGRFLSNIVADTDRLDRLVRRILDLARADALMPRGDEACDVAPLVAETVTRLREEGLLVSADVDAEARAAIERSSFDIVLGNLLENARQHAGPSAAVHVTAHKGADEVVVEVSDDGVGISAGNADRIFDRFFTTARDAGGTGLGLVIARRRVEAFGGRLDHVPSARGTCFRIRMRKA
ncbi:HAMP domain-containing sensor histidine kinase [Reyranella sp.]|uniref:sensor histidine kinase n=1 Tax=Reyranella sp. TaxID=1929291 RepID=UPI003C7A6567